LTAKKPSISFSKMQKMLLAGFKRTIKRLANIKEMGIIPNSLFRSGRMWSPLMV
jgi:hypothetical protein